MTDRMPHTTETAADQRAEVDQLAEATVAALRAPSILNTQPWRWQLTGNTAELWIDRGRQLPGLDPDGRLSLLSCGVALHHAVTALRAGGYAGAVTSLDDDRRPDLVARLRRGPQCTVDMSSYRAIYARRTDRRPFADTPPTWADIALLQAAAEHHGVHLQMLTPDQVPELASAVYHAGVREHVDEALAADLTTWASRPTDSGDGISPRTTTAPGRRTVPPRYFNPTQLPGLPLGEGNDRGTAYTVLFTDGDEPSDWLAAGEALSDVWLTLTARHLAASPISEVVEMASARESIRQLVGGIGYPAIVLRIGVPTDSADAPPASARRSGTEVIGLPSNL
jgi:nitroreductase